MLCAKYDYKMDIAVKQEEAREDGILIGKQQKAIEDAKILIAKYNIPIEQACADLGISPELIK